MADIDLSNSVSIASILDVVAVCSNLPPRAINKLQALNLDNPHQTLPLTRVSESTLIELWRLIEKFHPSPYIGLIIGQKITPESKGVLASWVSQSETIGEALCTFQKNIVLMNPSERWSIVNNGTYCTLMLTTDPEKKYPQPAIERSMSAMVAWARMLSAHPFPIERSEFRFSQPNYKNKFEAIFGSKVIFNSKENQLTFRADLLELPIPSSSRYIKEMMEENANRTLRSLNDANDIKTQVTQIVSDTLLNGNVVNIDVIASKLNTSRQTLYRKLEKENTTYKSIVDDVRKKKVIASMRTSHPPSITEISYSVGFKDTSSFYKAFKRWFNTTPKEYLSFNR
ncbi:AraC family transcriptional regulator ligand-binding domain-containing protein [Vibrio amylolyticus]|uniref:AraC family transcriptional regulator n=1 Tax=Vibrio amylolyticus TaxID=2847292 RepID=UPI003553A97E